MLNFDWKTVAALGLSFIGGILASKIDKADAKEAFTLLTNSVFKTKEIVEKNDDTSH